VKVEDSGRKTCTGDSAVELAKPHLAASYWSPVLDGCPTSDSRDTFSLTPWERLVTNARASSRFPTIIAIVAALGLAACGGDLGPTAPPLQPELSVAQAADVRAAVATHTRHTPELLAIRGVVGTAVTRLPSGRLAISVLLESSAVTGVPASIEGLPVTTVVTGRIMALSDPTTRLRPAPTGYSVGHFAITAGTIGARVVDASGNVYVLSNNHVLANSNGATIGDAIYQPGPFDGGTAADQIATLFAFRPIVFSSTATNTMDAAIARSSPTELGNATPIDDGYGAPSSTIYGDANGDGLFDDRNALLGVPVQKYGRTTKLTKGTITGINATVSICYEVVFIFCTKSARFVDQLIIDASGFSGGGDSGSLIVTDDANRNPVALLFAGSSTQTIANRIDLVLTNFGVAIDDGNSAPPDPVTDIGITGVTAPASVTVGATANVVVTIRNVGNQDVAGDLAVTLRDATAGVDIGSQTVAGLAAGATTTRTFAWNTSDQALGPHTLTASHNLADANAANDQRSATVTINPPAVGMHVGDLDGTATASTRWSATVEVTIHDASHNPINGATVVGRWSRTGLASNTCTTGEGGGFGTCIFLFPSMNLVVPNVSFTVESVTRTGSVYQPAANHDPDGSSNGTTITIRRP
jgi:hypothetical protein